MRNIMSYVLPVIYVILILVLYPLLVPAYVSPKTFVIIYLLFVFITAGTIRIFWDKHDNKKK